ncbi:hypothetical protein Ndes2526B_g06200 [Nannochloris sp. 'desiccata']
MIGTARSLNYRQVACKAAQGGTVTIRFSIPFHTYFGQHLRVVGGCESLGNWNLDNALPMVWAEGDIWSAEAQLPADQELSVEYKYVVCEADGQDVGAAWKPGNNFVISLPGGGNGSVKVKDEWDETSREVQIEMIKNAGKGGGRKKNGGSDREESDAVAAISTAANSALEQLEAAVNMSLNLLESSGDVASAELLAADRMVAAAEQRSLAMLKALDVAASSETPLPSNRTK